MQEEAHDAAAPRTGHRLRDGVGMDQRAQPMLAKQAVALVFGQAFVHFRDLAGERHVLQQQGEVHQHQDQRSEQRERTLRDLDLQQRQLDRRLDQQVLVRDAGERDHEECNQRHEAEPGIARGGGGDIHVADQLGDAALDAVDDLLP